MMDPFNEPLVGLDNWASCLEDPELVVMTKSLRNMRNILLSFFINSTYPLKQHFGSRSGSTSIPAPDPDLDPLRFLSSEPDPDPSKKALIWIQVASKLFRVKSITKCLCYLRNAFSKFWRLKKNLICPTWISLWKIWKIGTRIRIHFGTGSGSTFSKCGSEDPDPDPLLRKGGSEDPDPIFQNVDPRIRIRIRIHVKMRWIRNAVANYT